MRTTGTEESAAALETRADHEAPAPSARLEKTETQSTVLAGLELLPEKQREALRLKFQQGLSYAEISRITEIWARVAEDFAPFDINVTTVDPGSFNNREALRVARADDAGEVGRVLGVLAVEGLDRLAQCVDRLLVDGVVD